MSEPSTLPLLLEIGCEEIPARFLSQAQKDFGERLCSALEEARLFRCSGGVPTAVFFSQPAAGNLSAEEKTPMGTSALQTYSTPRRLVAQIPAILARQPDKVEEITGPPVKVAVDKEGKYTRAAESFAQKNSATVADLTRITTAKGEYLAVKKTTPGRPALEVLSEILPGVITGISFPKSMVWTGKSGPRFVRPIRWILALLGEGPGYVVPFEIAGVKAANFTFGHRSKGGDPLTVTGFGDYAAKLRQRQVEFDPESRREWIELFLEYAPRETKQALAELLRAFEALRSPVFANDPEGRHKELLARIKALPEDFVSRAIKDKELENWLVNSTEWPRPLVGQFEERFLKLPREILVTVMRDHQKYFAVEDGEGRLRPKFVTILNVEGDPSGIIKRGHERVLTARFSDAEFFWNADQKIPLRDRVPVLDRVTYQAKLGSYGDKVRRMEAIAKEICDALRQQGKMTEQETSLALGAVQLCKCDLTTQMVQEFTELQGIVGGLYARAQGEPAEVADAIYDHYLPQGGEDECPRSVIGSVVSLSDKLDGIVGGLAAGLEPTGSSDPFGLRRAGNGVVRISVEGLPGVDLHPLATKAMQRAEQERPRSAETSWWDRTYGFLEERVAFYLQEGAGLRHDTVRAVISQRTLHGWSVPADARARGRAVERIRQTPDFSALATAAKRTRNILTKSAKWREYGGTELDSNLFETEPERALNEAFSVIGDAVRERRSAGDYEGALRLVATLRPVVDSFFDNVLVMTENAAVRKNRLRLLFLLDGFFSDIADLSEIEGGTSAVVEAPTSRGQGM